jgi:poly(3-hydroxybutyrate) depolymerase
VWSFRKSSASLTLAILASAPGRSQATPTDAAARAPRAEELVVRDWLVISPLEVSGRRPFRCDAVYAKHLLDRSAAPPKEGDALTGELAKEQRWSKTTAKESGEVDGSIGWAYAAVESPSARVALAELEGASTLYVNGAPFAGDLYRYGFRGVPVALRKGKNDVYVTGMRGGFSLKLRDPESPLVLAGWDATFPDASAGQGAVLVLNATDRARELSKPARRKLLPLEAAKVPISFDTGETEVGKHPVRIDADGAGATSSATFEVEVRTPLDATRRTFMSAIDGSVQPYAVLPAPGAEDAKNETGLVLTLHGAGVDALGQVRSYSPKSDFWIVAPTNRRPFGFDWQDWGRLDAYEVLRRAEEEYEPDPDRIYLAGHSMGGHGTWHLAANDPDTFAAIAPSAGWISFDTYGTRPKGALADLWQRADGASRTLDLLPNLATTPAYILHGDADDNVPVGEALRMQAELNAADGERQCRDDVVLDIRHGAGHWWDGPAARGVDCVDWPPIFELFRATKRRADPDRFEWVSVDPSVSSRRAWIEVAQPLEYGRPFRVETDRGQDGWLFLQTENVRRLNLQIPGRTRTAYVAIDGVVLPPRSGWYVHAKDEWVPEVVGPGDAEKSPTKSGPFKRAFDRRFVFVYGTSGNEDENREQVELARWLSESWWYRGNGSTEIFSDREFLAHRAACVARDVILFGNADTNAAWRTLVPATCPLAAKRGSLRFGERSFEGAGLAALCVYPRADDATLVGLFADTGAAGTRLLATIPVFVSGVGLPDYALFGPDVLAKGDGGVLAAGWFDDAWRL